MAGRYGQCTGVPQGGLRLTAAAPAVFVKDCVTSTLVLLLPLSRSNGHYLDLGLGNK